MQSFKRPVPHVGGAYSPATLPLAIDIAKQSEISCVSAIEGDIDDAEARRCLEAELFRRIAERDIVIDLVSIDGEGVCFVVDTCHIEHVRRELATLNLAVRITSNCARFSIVDHLARPRNAPVMMARVVQALTDANITIIHCTSNAAEVSIIVADRDALQAEWTLRALAA